LIDKIIKNFKHDIYRQGSILFLATAMGNVFNMLYHIVMVRVLSPEEYGILNALFACILFFSLPTGNIQITVTRFVARYHGLESKLAIKKILRGMFIRILFLTLVVGGGILLLAPHMMAFLKLHNISPVIYMAGVVSVSLLVPVPLAGLHGLQKFLSLGLTLILTHFSKFVLAVIFLYLGWGVNGALNSIICANLLCIAIAVPILKKSLKGLDFKGENIPDVNFKEIYIYILPVSVATLTFMLVTNLDVILVKHFFEPLQAGFYSIAQVIGRMILFLPMGICMVMFPKVVYSQVRNEDTIAHFKHSMIFSAVLVGIGSMIIFLFPALVLKIFAGKIYPQCLPLIRRFAISMALFSLNFNFLLYFLSTTRWKYVVSVLIFPALEAIAISMWHPSLTKVLDIVICLAFIILMVNIFVFQRVHTRP
jgi:O-antigen/teichoic acid export membrane protein